MSPVILICIFLLPIFPFSLLTNWFLTKLGAKLFSVIIISLFIVGNIALMYVDNNSTIIELMALFTILFYSFRLLGVSDLKFFILYLYPIIASFAWLWYLNGGNILELLAIKLPLMMLLLSLYGFLSGQFSVVHQKSLRGLGNVMPRWSVLFILSLFGVGSSLLFLGYEFLEVELSRLPLIYGIVLVLSWIFINWASIKTIEWLIYGEKREDRHYIDLNNLQISFMILFLLLSVSAFVFYSMKGLV